MCRAAQIRWDQPKPLSHWSTPLALLIQIYGRKSKISYLAPRGNDQSRPDSSTKLFQPLQLAAPLDTYAIMDYSLQVKRGCNAFKPIRLIKVGSIRSHGGVFR